MTCQDQRRKGDLSMKSVVRLYAVALVLLLTCSFGKAAAQDDTSPTQVDWPYQIAKVFLALIIIVGLIYLTIFLLRKSIYKGSHGASGDLVRILSSVYLGPKRAIFLVKVAGRILVLGVTDETISTLSEITDEETISQIVSVSQEGKGTYPQKFSEYLSSLRGKT